jgi:hypothetical protein
MMVYSLHTSLYLYYKIIVQLATRNYVVCSVHDNAAIAA